MTLDEVNRRVREIERESDDEVAAHSDEDALHRAVLRAIAEGARNPAELANAALMTEGIEFSQWCA